MGKKQRERKQRKLEQQARGRGPLPELVPDELSPQARQIVARLGEAPNLDAEKLMQVLIDTADIYEEPEFQELVFPPEQTRQVRDRIMGEKELELRRAAVKSDEEAQEAYDEIRIQIIDELATRDFRRDVLVRFDKYLARIMRGNNTDQIETALILRPLLEQRDLPWGIIGLVTMIYEESSERAGEAEVKIDPRVEQVTQLLGLSTNPADLGAILADPEKLAELQSKIEAHPELFETVDDATDDAIGEFEVAVWEGKVELDLYSDEEIMLGLQALNEIAARHPEPDSAHEEVDAALYQIVGAALTPERLTEIKSTITTLSTEWSKFNPNDATVLQLELAILEEEEPAENSFLLSAYMGQLRRRSEEWFGDEDETEAEDELQDNA